ncbi:MAG: hypothetical protein AAF590_03230 [Pseudomonadota bacterium]
MAADKLVPYSRLFGQPLPSSPLPFHWTARVHRGFAWDGGQVLSVDGAPVSKPARHRPAKQRAPGGRKARARVRRRPVGVINPLGENAGFDLPLGGPVPIAWGVTAP